jgi:hypothetical protein
LLTLLLYLPAMADVADSAAEVLVVAVAARVDAMVVAVAVLVPLASAQSLSRQRLRFVAWPALWPAVAASPSP